ncbi:MAG TPA: NosD domain-containing protein [Candidatus Acidoferrum sp.]|nr:NosD domain-containing protein [Candidatus Acidoferrum sp.]
MRILLSLLSLFISIGFSNTFIPSDAADEGRKPDIVVDDDKVQCPNATFSSIQAAVSAANPGDLIRVCPGTYAEQVVVDRSLTLRADTGVMVMPSNMTANTIGTSGEPLAVAILVKDAPEVNIEGFIVDGSTNGITECTPILVGILFQDASGTAKHNAVRHMNLGTSLNGCQSGDGIDVISSSGQSSKVMIEGNSVHDYQKNGITGNEVGTTVAIQGNAVTGIGPTTGAAQNGIQVGFGAQGIVEENNVADNVWSPCISAQQCLFNATGILVFESDGVEVKNNRVGTSQVGIFIGGDDARVEQNAVFNSEVLVGIELAGDNNQANGNRVTHSDDAAVLIQGNNNRVRGNRITEAGIGILKVSGSTGNDLRDNSFFATTILVQDPAPQTSARVSPVR